MQKTAYGEHEAIAWAIIKAMNEGGTNERHPTRIGVLDNDPCALDCIVRMLRVCTQRCNNRVNIWSTTFPTEAIQICCDSTKPTEILLLDMALRGVTGPRIAHEILRKAPHTHIIGMTSYDVETYRENAEANGVPVLLDKASLPKTLQPTISRILQSTYAVPPEDTSGPSSIPESDTPTRRPLSAREIQVVALSLQSLNNKQIGKRMEINVDTVSSYRRNIRQKLNARTWYEALSICQSLHIV